MTKPVCLITGVGEATGASINDLREAPIAWPWSHAAAATPLFLVVEIIIQPLVPDSRTPLDGAHASEYTSTPKRGYLYGLVRGELRRQDVF